MRWVVSLFAVVSLATLWGCSQQPPTESGGAADRNALSELEKRSPLVGKPAPDVELEALDDSHFSLRAQQDTKIVILDFWATWCGPCVMEMPLVAQVADEYRDKAVALYCLNQGEDADTIRAFLDEEKLDVPVVLDAQREAARAYDVEGIPTLVLIDKAGVVRSVHVGYSPDIAESLKEEIDTILAGKNVAAERQSPDET